MTQIKKDGILIFVKYPEIGTVKSRLSSTIDPKVIVKIYTLFVQDILYKLKKTPYETILCYYPTNFLKKFKNWLGKELIYIPQIGDNLGDRFKNCFYNGFELGFSKLVVIGSDSPDLNINIIIEAFEKLDNHDAVIGPSLDGGYYLLGFTKKKFKPIVFNNIPWSTSSVFELTKKSMKKSKLRIHILPKWYDIDVFEDLIDFYKKNQNSDFKNSETMIYLKNYFKK